MGKPLPTLDLSVYVYFKMDYTRTKIHPDSHNGVCLLQNHSILCCSIQVFISKNAVPHCGIIMLIMGGPTHPYFYTFEWSNDIFYLQHGPGKYNASIPLLHLCLLQPSHCDFYSHRDFLRHIIRMIITTVTFKWKSPWLLFAPWLCHGQPCDFYLSCV